ncbi:MAG: hypothetical protein E7423_05275 [Ruminococcaceae bacterium]|nr:hypothetical protein [Oscillospiraceae bacterium]
MCICGDLLSVEATILKMTSLPARIYGFRTKGQLHEGMDADLVVFDPDRLIDNATVADYAALNVGLNYAIAAGQIAAVDGRVTGIKAGKILPASL